jgi:hypothetical protein
MYNTTMPKKLLMVLGIILLLAAGVFGALKFYDVFNNDNSTTENNSQNQSAENENSEQQPVQSTGFDKTKYSTDTPASPWWVVNKTRPLPDGYVPADL